MSKIALTPNASGTGVFTISSPATSTNRTLTLPDEAGTVLTSASSLASANLTGTVASGRMPAGSVIRVISSTLNSVSGVNSTNTTADTTPNSIIQQSTFSFQPSVNNSKFFVCIPIMLKGNRSGPSDALAALSWVKQASSTAPTTAAGFTTNEIPSCFYRSTVSSPSLATDARHTTMNCQGLITPNATTNDWVHVCVKTYTTYANSSASYNWFEYGSALPIFAWEIAA
jgi:hypothetical protein